MVKRLRDFLLSISTSLLATLICTGAVVDTGDKVLFTNPYYGQREVTSRDCQIAPEDPPKLIYHNDSYRAYFSLSCVARYPVTVDFEGVKPFYATVSSLVANASPTNNTGACYIVNLGQYLYYQNYISPVGNFTCQGVTAKGNAKSSLLTVWANAAGHGRRDYYGSQQAFVVQDDLVVFVNNKTVKAFWIPCVASKPDLKGPILKKYSTNADSNFLQLDINKFPGFKSSFDKFLGFRVEYNATEALKSAKKATTPAPQPSASSTVPTTTTASLPSHTTSVTGTYYCDTVDHGLGSQQPVNVEHADFLVFPNQTNITASDRQLLLECHADNPISFKIGDGSTELKELKQSDAKDFKNYGYNYGIKSLFKMTSRGVPAGSISCVEVSSGKTIFSWKFDNAYICQCEMNSTLPEINNYYHSGSNEDHEFGEGPVDSSSQSNPYDWTYFHAPYRYAEITCYNDKAKDLQLSWMPCGNSLECNMKEKVCDKNEQTCNRLLRQTVYLGGVTTNRRTYQISAQSGIFQCNADGYASKVRVTSDVDGNVYVKGSPKLLDTKSVSIKASETHVFIGDKMLYSCRTAPDASVGPAVWAFQFDDDKSFNYSFYDYGSYYRYDRYGNREDSMNMYNYQVGVIRTTYLTIPTRKASKLWCFAPKWNSTQWLNTSIDLDIEDADITQNPPDCPRDFKPIIVMYRNSTSSRARKRLPHRVDGKDAVFVFDPVNSVSLYCFAKYPVRWMKDGMNLTHRRQARANCRQPNGIVKVGYLYKTTVVFDVNSFNATGNYTCAFTQYNAVLRQASTYIYAVSGPENRTTFVNEGSHHVIKVPWLNGTKEWEQKKWVVLPCRTNQPHFTPYLFIDYLLEDRIERIFLNNEYLKFNSKVGFTINVSRKMKGNVTTFFCSDHKDGSFIGSMFTVELVYEKPNATVSPTKQPIVITTSSNPETSTVKGTSRPVVAQPVTGDKSNSGNSGFIISIVVLSAGCVASIAIIYRLLQKTKIQEKKLQPSGHEFDWARAAQAASNHSHIADDDFKGIVALQQEAPVIEPIPDLGSHFANLHNVTKPVEPAEADLINPNSYIIAQKPEEEDRSLTEVGSCDFRYQKL